MLFFAILELSNCAVNRKRLLVVGHTSCNTTEVTRAVAEGVA